MGASRALNVSRESLDDAMRELGMEEGFDVGFEMSGNAAALREMLRTMNHGGSISMLGIPPGETAIDWNQVIFKGLVIKGIYGREMFETWYKMSSMLQSGLERAAGHHPSLGDQRLPGRLPDHEFRQIRQNHPGLDQPVSARTYLRRGSVVSSDFRVLPVRGTSSRHTVRADR